MDTNRIIANNIRSYMEQNNLSQVELSKLLGVSATAIRNWTSATRVPRMPYIDKMCEVFHCTRAELLGDAKTVENIVTDELTEKIGKELALLNNEGKQRVLDYINDLSERYRL